MSNSNSTHGLSNSDFRFSSNSEENDDDTGDSEYEIPVGSRDDEDDSIAADDDIADEEEINNLMRESVMSLSELLAVYGMPPPVGTENSLEDSPHQTTTVSTSRATRRRVAAISSRVGAFSSSSPSYIPPSLLETATNPMLTPSNYSDNEPTKSESTNELVKSTSLKTCQSSTTPDSPRSDFQRSGETEDKSNTSSEASLSEEEEEEIVDRVIRKRRSSTYSTGLWCRAYMSGTPSAYNSADDEDYQPSVEGSGDWRGEVRVGEEYQAHVPPALLLTHAEPLDEESNYDGRLLWRPGTISEHEVVEYQRSYAHTLVMPMSAIRTPDDEEALFLLMQSNYNRDEALQRLFFKAVQPFDIKKPSEPWSDNDCVAFERGFALYNKNFHLIRDNKLRHKTVEELVHFYYFWKKTSRHDEFMRSHRMEKRKSLHPGIHDFMDCLLYERASLVGRLTRGSVADATLAKADTCVQPPPPSDHIIASQFPEIEAIPMVSIPRCNVALNGTDSVRITESDQLHNDQVASTGMDSSSSTSAQTLHKDI